MPLLAESASDSNININNSRDKSVNISKTAKRQFTQQSRTDSVQTNAAMPNL